MNDKIINLKDFMKLGSDHNDSKKFIKHIQDYVDKQFGNISSEIQTFKEDAINKSKSQSTRTKLTLENMSSI